MDSNDWMNTHNDTHLWQTFYQYRNNEWTNKQLNKQNKMNEINQEEERERNAQLSCVI